MGIGRISTNYAFIRSISSLNESFTRMDELREMMSSGKRINRASDDPVGMNHVFSLQSSIRANEQYIINIENAIGRLNSAQTTLSSIEDLLIEIRDMATITASSASSSAERAATATEVEILLEELVRLANHQYRDQFVFGGTNTVSGAQPLSRPFNIQYDGAGNISGVISNPRGIDTLVYTTITQGLQESVNISGSAAFQPNGAAQPGDIFQTLVDFRQNLLNNDINALQQSQNDLDAALVQVTEQDVIVGSKINRLELTKQTLELTNIDETEMKSKVEDVDYAKLLVEYSTAELLLNSSLSATATLLQNSLMNFI